MAFADFPYHYRSLTHGRLEQEPSKILCGLLAASGEEGCVILIWIAPMHDPFVIEETTESLDADWEGIAEVLNQVDVFGELLTGWESVNSPLRRTGRSS